MGSSQRRTHLDIVRLFSLTRKYLVVIRVGDSDTLHPEWLRGNVQDRNWDLLVSYYGSDPNFDPGECDAFVRHQGQKWPAIQELYLQGMLEHHEFVWFPDVDIRTTMRDINLMFETCRLFELDLAQPSLSARSHISHDITQQRPNLVLRYTNFVEMMIPVFSQPALRKCVASFDVPGMGWGLDYVWPLLLGYPLRGIAIIDAIPMDHTQPQGATYDTRQALEHKSQVMNQYGVNDHMTVFSTIPR